MHKAVYYFLPLLFICLSSCKSIETKDLAGEWIVNNATYNNLKVVAHSNSFKITMLPTGYQNKNTINFDTSDFTVILPGMNTEDIPCKWKLVDDNLHILLDTLSFSKTAFAGVDSLRILSILKKDTVLKMLFKTKHDSVVKAENSKIALLNPVIKVYTGIYHIKLQKGRLILTSATTRFELLNVEYIFKNNIDKMFKGL